MFLQLLKDYGPDAFAAAYRMLPEDMRGAIHIAIRPDVPDNVLSRLERILCRSYDPIKVYEQAARELPRPYFKGAGDGQNALGVQEILSAFALSEIVESFLATIAKAEQEGTLSGLEGLRAVASTFTGRLAALAQAYPSNVRAFVAARLKEEHAAGKVTEQVAEDALKQRAEAIRQEERLRILNAIREEASLWVSNSGDDYWTDSTGVHRKSRAANGALTYWMVAIFGHDASKWPEV